MNMRNRNHEYFENSFKASFITASENQSILHGRYKITVLFQFPDSLFNDADWSEFEVCREDNFDERTRCYKTVFYSRDSKLKNLTDTIGSATNFTCANKGNNKNTLQVRTLS